ncbi:hypothetical protein Vadar_007081 [Vaccinium darrowii]|uniref:Uncharacterized protein n=1 Tax=Vaccinium darrowii TaxID=229202 RepID=A0ACB7XFZ3_9ERIC|nr:hypothetical protein Vadar_007081 [Vaccinium darrowii]
MVVHLLPLVAFGDNVGHLLKPLLNLRGTLRSRESTGRASVLLEMKAAMATSHTKGVGLCPPLTKTPYFLPHWCAAGETLSICDL